MSTWLYHRSEAPHIFQPEEVEDAMRNGWVDSPAKVGTEADGPDERDELFQRAAELGLKPDKRWGLARLQKAIADHDDGK